MFIAAVGDIAYNIVLIAHIFTAIAAFAPAFTYPVVTRMSKDLGPEAHHALLGSMNAGGRRGQAIMLIATGVLGFALQGISDGAWSFGQVWLILAILVWVAMNAALHALIIPNERKMADGDSSAAGLAGIGGAAFSILLIVMLYLMVFKPGI